MTDGMTEVAGRDYVWVLHIRTQDVWWLVGVFTSKRKAEALMQTSYPAVTRKDVRYQRRTVR